MQNAFAPSQRMRSAFIGEEHAIVTCASRATRSTAIDGECHGYVSASAGGALPLGALDLSASPVCPASALTAAATVPPCLA